MINNYLVFELVMYMYTQYKYVYVTTTLVSAGVYVVKYPAPSRKTKEDFQSCFLCNFYRNLEDLVTVLCS